MRIQANLFNAQLRIPSGLLGDAASRASGHRFWMLFGGICLICGVSFLAVSAGVLLLGQPLDGEQTIVLSAFLAAGVAIAAVGGVIVQRARAAAARDRRLMRSGIELPATVTEIRRSAIDINREPRWHVRYRYEYSDAEAFEAESRALPWDAVEGLHPGDKVRIKVDLRQPAESLFVGPAEGSG